MGIRTRNWRQRWDPNAPLVYTRRMRMGSNPKKPYVLPGDPVTKKQRNKLGISRLRRWFETGIVELANWTPPEPKRRRALQRKAEAEKQRAAKMAVDGEKLRQELEAGMQAKSFSVDSEKLRADLEASIEKHK